ncbi:MAG TPA: type II CRISPR RNA-guided endonuclease Cas9, partial [Candidatus Mediterraneibacter merdipullorum]|nr:type II CRISPR RNA-guided endonuclease Cas9 [Candidatus Mediterraneibacter merdipullorum]
MGRYEGEYYLGLDVGTDSVGYAVTDKAYHVLDFRGRAMWGSRLFEAAETAENRRLFRTNRRRLQRRKWRIELLQELFSEEICKVDPGFYQRIKDSMLWAEDKSERQIYSLFNDKTYTDADFYRTYPTIYHLRKALITEEHPFDIRFVYVALHHLIKHRGHFLFAGSVENAVSFSVVFEKLKTCLSDELDIEIECLSEHELEAVLKNKSQGKRDKNSAVMKLLGCNKNDRLLKAVIGLMCGLTVKLEDLFDDTSLKEIEKPFICFAGEPYDELRAAIESDIHERCAVIDAVKAVYDWSVLADILKGGEYENQSYLSVGKVASYEKHREDLKMLKKVIKSADADIYRDFFQKTGKDNYCAYIGSTTQNGKKQNVKKCTYDDLKKSIRKIINTYYKDSHDEDVQYILKELDNESFLPLQVTKDNGVIPYQINEMELKKILENAQKYLPFLNQTDEKGMSVKDKIVSIFEFRVPYYVGPLNTNGNKNAWA